MQHTIFKLFFKLNSKTMKRRNLILILCLFLGFTTFAQRRVTGVVNDTQNAPVPGVTILEKGTTNGVISDMNGSFAIDVAGNESVLVFSFIGMETQELLVGTQTVIRVALREIISDLDEVVVIGYGVQKKRLTTGATVSVSGENIEKLSTVSPMTALQGQTPGVSIIKTSGEPGSGFKVNIRGMGTVGNSQPLYVIDGVPGGNIDYLSPSDIESIDVLKDAASAAIYGSRAANGVVLVTTKRGAAAAGRGPIKANISYDGYYGVQNLYKKLPLANAQEYSVLLQEARVNSGLPLLDFAGLVPDWNKIQSGEWQGTDWLDELTVKNAPTQNHAINIFGGNNIQNYSMGLSYTNQEGIFGGPVNSNYERYTFRLNSDYTLIRDRDDRFDVLKVGETLRYAYSERSGIGTGNQYWNDVFSASVASPFLPMYDSEGNYHYAIPWDTHGANPIGQMEYRRGYNLSKNHNLDGSIYLELQPIENLRYRSSFGYRMSAGSYRSYVPEYNLSTTAYSPHDIVQHNMSGGFNWSFENTLSYDFRVNIDHSFNVLAGMSAEKWGLGENLEGRNINSLMKGFEYAYLRNTPVISVDETRITSRPWGEGGILSYFGRMNYNFREKYMATLIMRADGSSNFAPGERWGYFPSVSAGWVMTEENFMDGARNFMDFLKLRASWGQNGNQSISSFQYLATISFENVNYFFGPDKSVVSVGGYPDILPNPNVTWETSEQLNIGLDARFIQSRLGLAFDWYKKTTKDWLVRADNLASFGTGAPFINGGDIENTGIEIALNWNDRIGSDFNYGVGVNLAKNKNEVTRIDNTNGIIYGPTDVLGQGTTELFRAQVGYPIGYFRGFKTAGVFQNQAQINNYRNSAGQVIMPNAQPGDLIFVDTNDDGVITEDDKVKIGDPNPDIIVGFNINMAYKGFDFGLQANGAFGFQIARSYRRWNDSPINNFTTDVFNRWHGEGTSNKYPRLTYGAHPNWQYISDIFIEDGDYLRISNVTLGYDFKRLLPDLPLGQARVYLSAQNLYTFTNYFGMDPEIGTSTNDTDYGWAKGIDIGYYPAPRTVLVGVSLKF